MQFFRRIRQNLLNQGQLNRYLIYGIGEILLVMIGILLALQVNNWNQQRRDQKTEIKYLQSLSADLKEQSNILTGLIEDQKWYVRSANQALSLIRENTHMENLDSLLRFVRRCSATRTFSFVETTYEDLKSTGNFQLIKNEDLKQDIIKIYKLLHEEDKISAKNNPILEEFFGKYIRQNQLGFYRDKNKNLRSEKLKDPEVLFTLHGLLGSRRGFAGSSIRSMKEIQTEIDSLVEAISVELKQ